LGQEDLEFKRIQGSLDYTVRSCLKKSKPKKKKKEGKDGKIGFIKGWVLVGGGHKERGE
jgi:hypothetical protein